MAKKKEKKELKKIDKGEIEKLIVDLNKKDIPPSKIGIVLRDEYGIKSDKKITKILESHGIKHSIPEELQNLIKKMEMLKKHLAKNKMDKVADRKLNMTVSKTNRLIKYFKKKRVLPANYSI